MDCDVSWKAKLSTLHDENVLLKHQVESTVKEQENISVLKGAPWRRKGVRHSLAVTIRTLALALGV
ncbi:hypothetical protein Tco_0141761, partial [Tanacetum coccineum]